MKIEPNRRPQCERVPHIPTHISARRMHTHTQNARAYIL